MFNVTASFLHSAGWHRAGDRDRDRDSDSGSTEIQANGGRRNGGIVFTVEKKLAVHCKRTKYPCTNYIRTKARFNFRFFAAAMMAAVRSADLSDSDILQSAQILTFFRGHKTTQTRVVHTLEHTCKIGFSSHRQTCSGVI